MAKLQRRAGQNIRSLAARRRAQALTHFLGAGTILTIPFLISHFASSPLKPLTAVNPAQTKS
jgi:hypothetical protein